MTTLNEEIKYNYKSEQSIDNNNFFLKKKNFEVSAQKIFLNNLNEPKEKSKKNKILQTIQTISYF